jgi:hypothetical protein
LTSLFEAKIISLLIALKMFRALYLKALELKNKSLLFLKIFLDIINFINSNQSSLELFSTLLTTNQQKKYENL